MSPSIYKIVSIFSPYVFVQIFVVSFYTLLFYYYLKKHNRAPRYQNYITYFPIAILGLFVGFGIHIWFYNINYNIVRHAHSYTFNLSITFSALAGLLSYGISLKWIKAYLSKKHGLGSKTSKSPYSIQLLNIYLYSLLLISLNRFYLFTEKKYAFGYIAGLYKSEKLLFYKEQITSLWHISLGIQLLGIILITFSIIFLYLRNKLFFILFYSILFLPLGYLLLSNITPNIVKTFPLFFISSYWKVIVPINLIVLVVTLFSKSLKINNFN